MEKAKHLYIARKNGLIKIGRSGDPKKRCRYGLKAELIAVGRDLGHLEAQLLEAFKDVSAGGEWFIEDPRLLELAESLGMQVVEPDLVRLETNVSDQAYKDLVLIAHRRGLSLASLVRMTMLEQIRESKWLATLKRDGRSIDKSSEEEVNRG